MSQRTLLQASDRLLLDDEVRLAIGDTVVGRTVTTDATPATLFTIPLLASRTTLLRVAVWARRTGGVAGTAEDGAGYLLAATYKQSGGTATLIGGVTALHTAESQGGWDATCVVSGPNVLVQVTGAAGNNVTWVGRVHVDSVNA